MATRIQSLFLIQAAFQVATDEDWSDTIAILDAAGNPIPLDGIRFSAILKTDRASGAAYLGLASPGAGPLLPGGAPLPSSVPRGLILNSGNLLCLTATFSTMAPRPLPGAFVFDVLATADGITKRVVDGSLTLIQGTG